MTFFFFTSTLPPIDEEDSFAFAACENGGTIGWHHGMLRALSVLESGHAPARFDAIRERSGGREAASKARIG